MTERKTFKRRVRERMTKTGERYTTARAQVARKRDRDAGARTPGRAAAARTTPAKDGDLASDAALKRATGKTWNQWLALLDRWDATSKTHTAIARHVRDEHGVEGWWSQTVAVGYERARGMRQKYQRAGGVFSVGASKTIGVPVGVLFDAFVDDVERKKWFPDASLTLRTAQRLRSARFDWEDGTTRVNVGFEKKGPSKAMIAIEHERLPGPDAVPETKAMWKERLADLKEYLES